MLPIGWSREAPRGDSHHEELREVATKPVGLAPNLVLQRREAIGIGQRIEKYGIKAVAVTDGAPRAGGHHAPEDDRRPRLLSGLRIHRDAVEIVEPAVKIHHFRGPRAFENLDTLVGHRAALRVR